MTTEGVSEQGVWTPAWKDADLDVVLETLVNGTSNQMQLISNHLNMFILLFNHQLNLHQKVILQKY